MPRNSKNSSHPVLSHTDGIADRNDRRAAARGARAHRRRLFDDGLDRRPTAAYLKSLNYPSPEFMSVLAHVVEWIVVISLVLGLGTRYGALLGLAFVVIAFATAHRYWEFPQAAQTLQYVFLSKDLADRRRPAGPVRDRRRRAQRRP